MTTAVGVALAGGQSRRMGSDKALLHLGGETFLARAVERLAEVCPEVLIADRGHGFAVSGYPRVADGPGRGPAAGILGAAAARPGRDLLVLACDLPAVPPELLRELTLHEGDWVLPCWGGRLEPLCALYRSSCLAALREQVAAGTYALHRLTDAGLSIRRLGAGELGRFGGMARVFRNLNTPEDLAALREDGPAG